MAYMKDIEADAVAKRKHDEMQKKNAADRLRRNAEWNKKKSKD